MNQKVQQAALLAVACNTMMLQVADTLRGTNLYNNKRKQLINTLTVDLEGFVSKLYQGMPEDEEMQYHALVRTVEEAAKMLASLTPIELDRFTALFTAFRRGEVYEASTDKQMANLINQKKVKPVTVEIYDLA